jgi:ribosome maturation factor RimP
MGARRPFFMTGERVGGRLTQVNMKEKQLEREISGLVESGLPGVEVLAVELSGPDRFTVYVDHPQGVDHGLCERVTNHLREFTRVYSVEVSSPGFERPLRKPAHFRGAVGRRVSIRTPERKRLRGEVVDAGERAVTVRTGDNDIEVPYEEIVRGNLIDEG